MNNLLVIVGLWYWPEKLFNGGQSFDYSHPHGNQTAAISSTLTQFPKFIRNRRSDILLHNSNFVRSGTKLLLHLTSIHTISIIIPWKIISNKRITISCLHSFYRLNHFHHNAKSSWYCTWYIFPHQHSHESLYRKRQ